MVYNEEWKLLDDWDMKIVEYKIKMYVFDYL